MPLRERRSEERLKFLAEASRLLSSSLDYETTLRSLARLTVPTLADWCAVEMALPDGTTEQLEVAHIDPEKVQLARDLRRKYPPNTEAPVGVHAVIRTGTPLLLAKIPSEMLEQGSQSEEHLRLIRALGLESAMVVPLTARGRVLGALTLVSAESGRHYDESDFTFAQELAGRAAISVDNARLYREAQTEIARRLEVERELQAAKRQLEVVLDGVADGLTAQDPAGRVVYANAAAARLVGCESVQEFLSTPVEALMQRFALFEEDGRPMRREDLPSFVARNGAELPPKLLRFRVIATGEERWSIVRARPVFDEDGAVRLVINIFRDVTQERIAAFRERVLADATAELGSSLDYHATLKSVARLVVPQLADWCIVHVVDDGGEIVTVEAAHRDPEKIARLEELARRYPADPRAPRGVGRIIQTGEPELVSNITDEALVYVARDRDHLELLRSLGFKSYMGVPLVARGRVLGTIVLVAAETIRHYNESDLAFATELGRRAGIAVDNARLFADAQAAIQKRDDFVSVASHELRTPLTSLVLTVSALESAVNAEGALHWSKDRLVGRVAAALRQVTRLTRLVDQLLDTSRIAAGSLTLDLAKVDVVALVREVVLRFRDDAASSRTDLVLDAPAVLEGKWDRERLDQVITNLVSNALKYGGGNPVHVRVSTTGDVAVIEVRDRGQGIAPDDQRRVFDRFERAATRSQTGMGLGLWIAKQIVEAHGGTISLTSEVGVGSTFRVELPLSGGIGAS